MEGLPRELRNGMTMLLVITLMTTQIKIGKGGGVPCYFIFGDSLADSGNNNHLVTFARATYPPYGVDFPFGCTGRFSNGRTAFDIMGELIGLTSFIPPFPKAWTSDVLKGVNYASAGAGILGITGKDLGDNIPLKKQLRRHRLVVAHINSQLGKESASPDYLTKCLYAVNMGNNDYIRNYFLPIYPTSRLYNPQQFAARLIQRYSPHIQSLYDLGARKVAICGLGLIGCTPNAIATYPTNGAACVDSMNSAAQLFNQELRALVDQFNSNHFDAHFTFINISNMMAGDPIAQGFKVIDAPCCKSIGNITCIPFQPPCANRSEYRFWDEFHSTEAMNRFIANKAFRSSHPLDTHPFDISHLISL